MKYIERSHIKRQTHYNDVILYYIMILVQICCSLSSCDIGWYSVIHGKRLGNTVFDAFLQTNKPAYILCSTNVKMILFVESNYYIFLIKLVNLSNIVLCGMLLCLSVCLLLFFYSIPPTTQKLISLVIGELLRRNYLSSHFLQLCFFLFLRCAFSFKSEFAIFIMFNFLTCRAFV